MAEPAVVGGEEGASECVGENQEEAAAVVVGPSGSAMSRKEKRKAAKKEKRKQNRKETAMKEREEEKAIVRDPEEQRRIQLEEERETERVERERKEFEERERLFLEALARKKAEEEEEEEKRMALEEELRKNQAERENELKEDEDWEYVEEGPPEIIWQGNEIIVKKKRVRVKKKDVDQQRIEEDPDRPISNPLPPQSEAFADHKTSSMVSAQQLLDNVAQQIPNFGTEQDKAHCPFHIKTGACRFGSRCSRVHFYPDKSCTLLIKNMYGGPGLAWEQDEGLEHTDEEVEGCYEEFYEDVHTEFLKFGEIVNFKVCRNGSFHLRGNVYVHYKSLNSAVLAYHSINGRYFAGKQITCEFVGVTRWKVAICGEYMKSRLKTCSRGTACNFIHCFRNPGGDYEWADWDKPPPNYWIKEMVGLFGYSDEIGYEREMEQERRGQRRNSRSRMLTPEAESRFHRRRSRSRERHTSGRKQSNILSEKSFEEGSNCRNNTHGQKRTRDTDSDVDGWDRDRDGARENYTRKSSRHHVKSTGLWDDDWGGKRRTHESGSDGDWSDREKDRDRHHGRARKSSKHQKERPEGLDDHDYHETRSETSGALLDRDRDGDKHRNRTRSRQCNEVSESPDDHQDSKCKLHDRDRNQTRTRKHSMHSDEVSGLSDDHGVSEKDLKGKAHHKESDVAKPELQRVSKHRHSSRRGNSSREASDGDFDDENLKPFKDSEVTNSGQSDGRIESRGLGSSYSSDEKIDKTSHHESGNDFSKKHRKSKRKIRIDENYKNDIPGRYSERIKSHDSPYYPDENVDEGGRWQPDLDPEEPQARKKR